MVHATVLFVRCSYLRACSSLVIGLNFMSHFDDRSPGRLTHFSWQVPLKFGKSHEMQSIHLLHGVLSKTGHVRRCVVICPSIGCCILRKSDYFSSIWSWTFSLYKTIFRTNLSGGFLTCLANLLKSPRNESGRRDGAWSLPTLCAFLCPNNHCDLLFVFLAHVNHSAGYQHLPESF